MWKPEASRWTTSPILALLLAVAPGCSVDTAPTGPRWHDPSALTRIEGDAIWYTNSVSCMDRTTGAGRFAFIAVNRQVMPGGPSDFLFTASLPLAGCREDDPCFPETHRLLVEPGFSIFNVDWALDRDQGAFEGRWEGESASWIYTLAPGGDPRKWVSGVEPSFTPDAGLVVYVSVGRDAIRSLNPASGGGYTERDGFQNASHPRVSPDGRHIACSVRDGERGQRIVVFERGGTGLADPVSHPDHLPGMNTGDGTDDDLPAWSPGGQVIAYRATIRENTHRHAIYITQPFTEPENPVRILAVDPRQEITCLRWHPNGQLLLIVMDGDVYTYPVPERYRGE